MIIPVTTRRFETVQEHARGSPGRGPPTSRSPLAHFADNFSEMTTPTAVATAIVHDSDDDQAMGEPPPLMVVGEVMQVGRRYIRKRCRYT